MSTYAIGIGNDVKNHEDYLRYLRNIAPNAAIKEMPNDSEKSSEDETCSED